MITVSVVHEGRTYDAEIATIEATSLGYEDHGIFTAQLRFAGSGWTQCAPAYALGGPACHRYVKGVIEALGVQSWEGVSGKKVYVLREARYLPIAGLADQSGERVLIFQDLMKEHRDG